MEILQYGSVALGRRERVGTQGVARIMFYGRGLVNLQHSAVAERESESSLSTYPKNPVDILTPHAFDCRAT